MKKILKSQLFAFILGVLISSVSVAYATYAIVSYNVSYSPKDTNWNVDNVEDAIDDLYIMARNGGGTCGDFAGVSWTYGYTGKYQEFVAPSSGNYKLEAWGAQGGQVYSGYSLGGYTSGELFLARGDVLYFYVGEKGNANRVAAWNGGGYGGYYNGKSGGGATDIRLVPTSSETEWNEFDSLKSRIMVAAGGGGDGSYNYSGQNSSAGGLVGYRGNYYQSHGDNRAYGFGGTQTAGGVNGNNVYGGSGSSLSSGFGYGASTNNISSNAVNTGAGGGGGGYYGGGAGGATQSGGAGHSGGGGSSFISGHQGCDAISEESTSTNIIHTGQPNHYSGIVFVNTQMYDGKGCKWTDQLTTECGQQPQIGGGVDIGNTGNGIIRVTFID